MQSVSRKDRAVSGIEDRKTNQWKKRNLKFLLIEPFKQIKLGLYVMAISVVFVLVAGFLIYQALTAQYDQVMEIFKVVDASKQWELTTNNVFVTSSLKISALFLGYLICLMAVVLRFTHKIYGPLVSIERYVDRVTEGKYRERVRVRDNDDLQVLVAKLNDLAEKLENRHGGNERRLRDRRSDEADDQHADESDSEPKQGQAKFRKIDG